MELQVLVGRQDRLLCAAVTVDEQVKCYALSPNDDSVWRRKIEGESEHFCDISAMQV